MREYLKSFFKEYDLTKTERITLCAAYERICECAEARDIFFGLINRYEKKANSVTSETITEIEAVARASGIHLYTATLITLICLFRELRVNLERIGLSKKNIHLTVADLVYKMRECQKLHGVVGTEHWEWHSRFIEMKIFAFGRLQFQLTTFKGGVFRKGTNEVRRGDACLAVHIPRNGSPLTERACAASYREAHEFFTSSLFKKEPAFVCASWLLYSKTLEILPPKSNIRKFAAAYDVVENQPHPRDNDPAIPFIFEKPRGTKIADLPRDTTLRAGYAEHLERGGTTGYGLGIFFYDKGEK